MFSLLFGCQLESPYGDNDLSDRLQVELQNMVDNWVIPGAIVVVVRDGEICAKVTVDYQVVESRIERSDDALFCLCSMTKPIVSVETMTLIEEGALSLNVPIEMWLPKLANARVYISGDVGIITTVPIDSSNTVRYLMSQTSGFSYHHTGNSPVNERYRRLGVM